MDNENSLPVGQDAAAAPAPQNRRTRAAAIRLRTRLRRAVKEYLRAREAEIAAILAVLDEGGKSVEGDKLRARLKRLDAKPPKGRRKDLRRIEETIEAFGRIVKKSGAAPRRIGLADVVAEPSEMREPDPSA